MVFVLMLIAAAGMIFGAVKMKQGMEWGKGLTIACAIVALILAGVHIKSKMGQGRLSNKEIQVLQEREAAYQRISAQKLGAYLAEKNPGTKAVVIRPVDFGYEMPDIENKLAGLRAGFGDAVEVAEVISPEIPPEIREEMELMKKQFQEETGETEIPPEYMMGGGMMEMMEASQFNKMTRQIPKGTDLVILLVDFPYDLENMTLLGMGKTVAGVINMPQPKMRAAIKGGYISAVVLIKPDGDFKSRDVPKEMDEAFDRRYVLVTAENVEEVAARYEGMFPAE